jgi:hypothetical protein
LSGETIFESGPGLRNWITPESADGFGMAVVAMVGGRFRVGRGTKISVGIDTDIDSGVGLTSGNVGEANSEVGEMVVGVGVGGAVGMSVSGICAKVGNCVDVAGTQAVKINNRPSVRKKHLNIIKL